ncbi:MAG: OmpH family outer membrane protein [Prevotellaceae bacterium]|jgi:outer membrane protein|nr:OmpH family outer membrane protein [Prevotellaceae bacterium]
MKKIVVGCTGILMVALLFASCNSSADNKSAETGKTSSGENAQVSAKITNIAFIKVDSLIQNYDLYHDFKQELEKKAKKLESDFDAKVKALERDMKDFNEKYEKMLITRSQAEEQNNRLLMRKKELEEEIAPKMRNELIEQETVMNRTINDAIQKYVNKYNLEKKYSLILNGAVVLVGDQAMDITSEILKGLNEEYIATKNSK